MSLVPVILSYNHESLTRRCLDSVIKHFGSGPIYLVHNGSQVEIVKSIGADYLNVQHIVLDKNSGFTGGTNRGLGSAFENGHDNVLFLTNDTVLEDIDFDKVPTLLTRENGNLLAPKIYKRSTEKIDSNGGKINLRSGGLNHLAEPAELESFEKFYVPGTAFVIDKKAWEKTGLFDESLGTYWEDVDYSLRASKRGVNLGVMDGVILRHGVGKTCHGNPIYTVYHFHRNRRIVVWRHGSFTERLFFAPTYLFETAARIFRYLINGDQTRFKLALRALFY